jgi:hypothetical protein
MLLRRIFGPTRKELTEKWGKLINDELNDLYSLLNIVRVIESRRMRGRACCTYEGRCKQGFGGET